MTYCNNLEKCTCHLQSALTKGAGGRCDAKGVKWFCTVKQLTNLVLTQVIKGNLALHCGVKYPLCESLTQSNKD